MRTKTNPTVPALALVLVTSLATAAAAGPPSIEHGRELMQQQAWAEAAKTFHEVAEADPKNGEAWFLMGYSLHADGQLEKALEIHRKAATFDAYHGIALYNVGCAHALLGHPEEALKALTNSAHAGFDVAGHAGEDPDLKSLHGHPHFQALMAPSEQMRGGGMGFDLGDLTTEGAGILDRIKTGLGQVKTAIEARAPEVMAQIQMIVEQAVQLIQQKIAELQGGGGHDMEMFKALEADPDVFAPAPPAPPDVAFGAVPGEDDIRRLMQDRDWKAAAAAWKRVVEADPGNGRAWHLLGYSLHAGGKLDEAIEVHAKAATFEEFAGIANYNLGCAYALQGETGAAFEALDKSRKAGGFENMLDGLENDSDLESLRKDPRFAKLLEALQHPDL